MLDDDDLIDAEDMSEGPSETTFRAFTKALPPRLSNSELESLHAELHVIGPLQQMRRDWALDILWLQTARLTVGVFFRMMGSVPSWADPMDLIQDGLLAARAAVLTWDPKLGTLATHVAPRVRGAMLDTIRREFKGSEDLSLGTPGELQTMLDTGPDAERLTELLTDESIDMDHELDLRGLRRRINRLPWKERLLVLDRHISGHNIATIAASTGMTPEAVRSRLRRSFRKLRTTGNAC